MPSEEPGDEGPVGPPPHPLDRPWIHPTEMFARTRGHAARPAATRGRGHDVAIALSAGVAGAVLVVLVLAAAGQLGRSSDPARPATANSDAGPDPAASVVAAARGSVVAVLAVTATGLRRASGVCVRDGQVMTSARALEGATALTVVGRNGRSRAATLLGSDSATGLALLRVGPGILDAAGIAEDGGVRVGAWVLAMGGGDGRSPWVTTGVVASMGGWVEDAAGVPRAGMITTNAATPAEADGGALLDRAGRVVGILVGAAKGGGSLALPMATARPVAAQLASTGRVGHAVLGIRAADDDHPRGGRVTEVLPETSADRAGVRVGDVVVAIDETDVYDTADLVTAILRHTPGDRVQLTVVRRGDTRRLMVRLEPAG